MAVFVGVRRVGPVQESLKDSVVYLDKGLFAGDVRVIVGPAPDLGVEDGYGVSRRDLSIGLDDFSNVGQEGFDVFGRGFDQDFAVVVLADVLSQEVKAVCDVGAAGLVC